MADEYLTKEKFEELKAELETLKSVKRKEIGILHLLGASRWYIRAPFIVEGILYGLTGALFGWIGGLIVLFGGVLTVISYKRN